MNLRGIFYEKYQKNLKKNNLENKFAGFLTENQLKKDKLKINRSEIHRIIRGINNIKRKAKEKKE